MTRLDQVVTALYDTVLDAGAWPMAMSGVAGLFGARSAALIRSAAGTGHVLEVHQHGHEPEAQRAYVEHYARLDPALPIAARAPTGQWLLGPDVLNPASPHHAEYVADYCRPFDLRWIVGAKLQDVPGVQAFLSLQRGYGAQAFEPDTARTFQRLYPHLSRVLSIGHEMSSARREARLAAAALDALAYAAVVVDDGLRIELLNRAAEQLLGQRCGLGFRHGRLRLGDAAVEARMSQAISRACGNPPVGDDFVMHLGARRAWQVRVLPLRPGAVPTDVPSRPLALVLLVEPAASRMDASALSRRFGLTAAEGAVLAALAGGASLGEAASQRGVSMATVRSQLKSIFAKTGTNTQARLMALVHALPPDRMQ